ncbi:uncharacterized protein OCT59_013605 [Rhizophagus irregularis]|uniref:uncharacterized protein n=1 Tax=Rhizophagus irregularis TaxID=588596 RepID=UPI0019F8590B|nr:hypothetical protein OCT59_013605 [Rhizophagus irregularis]GBC45738.2 hypothetical protein GLOIN_2v1767426 [Rhizophagus irregularis DAOM 181602=DAOM 197198]
MDFPKYNGNIHPNEWINDIQRYFTLKNDNLHTNRRLSIAISFVDPIISIPDDVNSFEKLCSVLKEDISFTVFKNTNERMLQSLKYVPENKGGNTSEFISKFRKLCYNAEINDIEEQKKYLYNSLPLLINHFDSISIEFYKRMENVDSINKLIKEFEDFVVYLSKLIVNESIVALKHVSTGKYLGSINNLCYDTGSSTQLVFVDNSKFGPNSLWKIRFNNSNELATYGSTRITLRYDKSDKFLGIYYGYYKSPSTNHTEVSCNNMSNYYWVKDWEFNHAKVGNNQGFLKSNDIINLRIKKSYDFNGNLIPNGQVVYLRSHDIQFNVGNDTFQEVVCHNERLGGNDEWCIELIKQYAWTLV